MKKTLSTLFLFAGMMPLAADCIDPMPDCLTCSDSGKPIDETISPDLSCKGCAE